MLHGQEPTFSSVPTLKGLVNNGFDTLSELSSFEIRFASAIDRIPHPQRIQAGILLPIIPNRADWNLLRAVIAEAWPWWERNLNLYPAVVIMLYVSTAFFEYEGGELWTKLAQVTGTSGFTTNQQTRINAVFAEALRARGFQVLADARRGDYVGTAVHLAGVPLSVWDGFLKVCEWAFWEPRWESIPDAEWERWITKLTLSRARLKRFLVGNREGASFLVREILELRHLLIQDHSLTAERLLEATFLRPEYFEEAPETAAFFRVEEPESLIQARCQLIFEPSGAIVLHLPPVAPKFLPAKWHVGPLVQDAKRSADRLKLNSAAFADRLNISLINNKDLLETQSILGIGDWTLFDMERDGVAVSRREELPPSRYTLVSLQPVQDLSDSYFETEECLRNEEIVFDNGGQYFLTELPIYEPCKLAFDIGGERVSISFGVRPRIEPRLYAGQGKQAGAFVRLRDGTLKVDHLPIFGLIIPTDFFDNPILTLQNNFKISINEHPTLSGDWQLVASDRDRTWAFYRWKWGPRPFFQQVTSGAVRDPSDLGQHFASPDLHGAGTMSIEAPSFGIYFRQQIFLDRTPAEMEECWNALPGAYLPWFLLAQSPTGMTWDDLMIARNIIAPDLFLSYEHLKKYEDRGFFVRKGNRWVIESSRAVIIQGPVNPASRVIDFRLAYCGDPSILWGLYRKMRRERSVRTLPIVSVINRNEEAPFLEMKWPGRSLIEVQHYLNNNNVGIGQSLWIH